MGRWQRGDTRGPGRLHPHGRHPPVCEPSGWGVMGWDGGGCPSCARVVSEAHRGGQELPGDRGLLSPSLQGTPGWTWRRRVWRCRFERQQLEPAGQEGETGLPRGPRDTRPWGRGLGPPHGCHVTPDLSLGLWGTPRLLRSCWQATRTPAVPGVPRYGSQGDRAGVSPGTPPAHRDALQVLSPMLGTTGSHRGVPVTPAPRHLPSACPRQRAREERG